MTMPEPGADEQEWPAEFSAICDSQRGRLVRWLTAIFGPRDAEDIAQEALARLYARPGMLDADADAWPWLAVVARNVGRDLQRHNAFSTTVDQATLDQLPDEGRVPDEVVARDDADRLALALTRISPRDRALLQLREVDGVSVGEIAARLGLNDNVVRQQLHRARRRLAATYVELGGERPGLVALLGLRAREFARRHGRLFDALAPVSPGVLAAAAPALAAAAGTVAVLVTGGGGDPVVARAAAPPVEAGAAGPAAAESPPGRLPLPLPSPDAVALPRPGASATPVPFVRIDERVGPAGATGSGRDPLDRSRGDGFRYVVYVDLPIVGRVSVPLSSHHSGQGPVCQALKCPTAIPTPPDGR